MSVRLTGRRVMPSGLVLIGCILLTTAGLTVADEVPLGPASIMRRNGALLTGNLLKARNGEVRIAGGIKPLEFRPGEVTAIQFEQFLDEPAVAGTVRLKYFYDAQTRDFERQHVMLTVGPWAVQQQSGFEKVINTEFQRDSSGQIISSRSVERDVEVFAAEATASANLTNKVTQAISVRLQLRVSATGSRPWVIDQEYVLQPSQEDNVTIRFPTRSLKITDVVVQDVFNRSLNDTK